MKRKIVSILASFCIAGSAFAFVGCGHEHTFAEDWSKDATHHWHAATCEHTEEKSDYAEHDYTDDADATCDTCGYTRIAPLSIWSGETADVPEAVEGVITITTAEQLAGVAKKVNEGTTYTGVTIKLGVDINLNNKEWTPIGCGSSHANGTLLSGARFMGNFDGQGHTINNLKITRFVGGATNTASATGVGLFGAIYNASVKNINIVNATVVGNHYVGIAVGHARGSVIEKVSVQEGYASAILLDEDENGDKAGVIVAFIGVSQSESSLVKDCSAKNCRVNAARDAGQIIGTFAIYDGDSLTEPDSRTTESGNIAENVVVSWNNAGTGANIENETYGRVVGSN